MEDEHMHVTICSIKKVKTNIEKMYFTLLDNITLRIKIHLQNKLGYRLLCSI